MNIKIRKKHLLLIFGFLFVPISIFAATSVSSGFQTDQDIEEGSLVSFAAGNSSKVELSNLDNYKRQAGVVSEVTKPLLSLSSDASQVQVVTSGLTEVFVSNIGGDIEAGDYLTASPIDGVAMKAEHEDVILGTAEAPFNPDSEDVEDISSDIENNGVSVDGEVYLGSIPVFVAIGDNPEVRQLSGIAGFAQRVSESLTERGVSPVRLLIVLIIFLISVSVIAVLLYGAVTGSIMSIGRNPLSKKSIYVSMYQVLGISAFVLLIALAAIYFILR